MREFFFFFDKYSFYFRNFVAFTSDPSKPTSAKELFTALRKNNKKGKKFILRELYNRFRILNESTNRQRTLDEEREKNDSEREKAHNCTNVVVIAVSF
jgi:hypothetical protein